MVASKPRNLRFTIAALAGLVILAGVGSIAARQIRSPAQIAADTAAPAASRITAPVERRALATEVIVRGTVRYGTPQEVVLPADALASADGNVVIESDQWFVPGDRDPTLPDRRHLALCIYAWSVR